jgi:hypothetical protein
MGIFRRRRTQSAGWRPLRRTSIPLTGTDAGMGDGDQVFAVAHMVAFGMQHPDGAVITVCAYASYASHFTEPDRYGVRLRYHYTSEAHPGWVYTGREPGPWDTTAYAGRADDQARELADLLASGTEDVSAWLPRIFGWDGEWFAVAEAREV